MFPTDTDFDTKITLETEATPSKDDPPFHILLLGDWSGRESLSRAFNPSGLRFVEVDRDNFESVLAKLSVGLKLKFQDGEENTISLDFKELDDFHPDKIFQKLSLFAHLRDVRQRLKNSNTFDDAAREVRSWWEDDALKLENEKVAPVSQKNDEAANDDLLDQILGRADKDISETRTSNASGSELGNLIGKLVKPYLIQTDAAEQSKLLMVVDEVVSDVMRKILHHPQFQALESAWRALYLLVRRIETNSDLKIFLVDVAKQELTENLKSSEDLSKSEVSRLVCDKGIEPWAVICGNYTFELNVNDAATLLRLAKLGESISAPFISHIKPQMFGFDDFYSNSASDSWHFSDDSAVNRLWATVRDVSEARYIGLALPRFLSRLPYGMETEPTESFNFEELTASMEHHQYLWTNPSFACALLLAQTFEQRGWHIKREFCRDLDNLPLHLYKDDGEAKTKSPAEVTLTQNNCEKLLEQGLMPLVAFRNSDKVMLARFQSISSSQPSLGGRWD